ncbi:acid phosphatase, partial [Actinomadura sp. DSM 109109]|nr:acid phosphatase [Actinomadura lepetitiana]
AKAMGDFLSSQGVQFNGVATAGDNFYLRLSSTHDMRWQTMFEDMYDAKKVALPFYIALGNHDYDDGKAPIELAYARRNPHSRWKLPGRWYRVDFPSFDPFVTLLVLDSNKPRLSDLDWERQKWWIEANLAQTSGQHWTICIAHHP